MVVKKYVFIVLIFGSSLLMAAREPKSGAGPSGAAVAAKPAAPASVPVQKKSVPTIKATTEEATTGESTSAPVKASGGAGPSGDEPVRSLKKQFLDALDAGDDDSQESAEELTGDLLHWRDG